MRTAKSSPLLSKKSLFLSAGIALSAALLSIAPAHAATTYTESGDAGDLPGTAQLISGAPNTSLDFINGTLTKVAGISEADMYKIYISSPTTFSATTDFFKPGYNNFDTQLFLFTVGGIGILANDDDGFGSQSTLPAGSFTLAAGIYDLLITGSSRYPSSAGGAIFPNYEDPFSSDPTGVYGPTGPGGSSAMTGYTGSSNEGGAYSIKLTGAQLVVPEPSTVGIFGAGIASLLLVRRRRSASSFSNASVSPL